MKLKDIYRFFVDEGIKTDPRHRDQIKEYFRQQATVYKKEKPEFKKTFDTERLWNPYADTRIVAGDPETEVKRILVGIDIEIGEILLAQEMNRSGRGVDLVIAHHPEGVALAGLDEVMHLQTDELVNLGIERKVAEDLMKKRIEEVGRKLHAANHARTSDAARLMNIPLLTCHTPSDNHVAQFLQQLMDRTKPKTLNDIVKILLKMPEYHDAAKLKAGPMILLGKETDKAGRVLVDMTGGTEGSKDIFGRLSQIGINTLLGMHLSENHYDKIRNEYMNVIIAGHIASDNLGLNLLFDKLQQKADIEIVACSGFRRFAR